MTKTDMTAFNQALAVGRPPNVKKIGRASCRERV